MKSSPGHNSMFANSFCKNRFLAISLTILAFSSLLATSISACLAQSSAPPQRPKREYDAEGYYKAPSTMRGKTVLIPLGTTFEGRIDQTISSEHSRYGQRFNIIMSSPVLLNGTDVVIPSGSMVIGEVVEAVPASQVPRRPGQPKIAVHGKLRIQVSGLKTPDGVTYPLVASIAGEVEQGYNANRTPLGTGVAYMGSAASFEAVNPHRKANTTDGRTGRVLPKVVSKNEFLKDQLYGAGDEGFRKDSNTIRSLVLRKRDYYVYEGSALSVRLTSPFKIGVNPPGMGVPMGEVSDGPVEDTLPPPSATANSGRLRAGEGGEERYLPQRSNASRNAPQQQPQPQPNPNPGSAIPADSF